MSVRDLATDRREYGAKIHNAWLLTLLGADPKHQNRLASAYLGLYLGDRKKAAKALGALTGAYYTRMRVGRWVRGEEKIPAGVKRAMQTAVLTARFHPDVASELLKLLDIDPLA
jgi:hypothetical protein